METRYNSAGARPNLHGFAFPPPLMPRHAALAAAPHDPEIWGELGKIGEMWPHHTIPRRNSEGAALRPTAAGSPRSTRGPDAAAQSRPATLP
eukprot:CAMPEP_0185310610 /NCGR_PEP_ID=MMETSP1363-20130426/25498_1 /TAXON_ID=38817 /ORGANISM="Gephyrocapsa oceanica, Strain RCC1303" /LENGTH=91 /DNA_ID=CAMNT_0027908185 /DNA_START=29 /DNA_END=300 /DNA_ORIENTATION=+